MTVDHHFAPGERRMADPVECALRALLERYPSARVAGLEEAAGGHHRLIAPPTDLTLPEAWPHDASPLIDQVVGADRVIVAKMWCRARLQGIAVSVVRLVQDPGRTGTLYFFDLRQRHRMMVAVFLAGVDDAEPLIGDLDPAVVPARFARARKNEAAVFVSADATLTQILGWPVGGLIGRPTLHFVHPDDRELGIAAWMEMLDTPGPGRRIRLRHQHRDGSWIWLEVTNHNRLSDPEHNDVLCEMLDISDEMSAHEAVRAREQLLAQLTDTVPIALFHATVTGELLFANRRIEDVTAKPVCRTLEEQLSGIATEDHDAVEQALGLASEGSDADIEFSVRGNGATRHCTLSVRPLIDANGTISGITGCIEDITEVVRTRRALEVKASSDPLTGCLNREAVLVAIQRFLDRKCPPLESPRLGIAVIFIDLDGFKAINDRHGHAAGDDLLISITARMRASIRSGDLIGRFGGDEFLVVCPDVSGPSEALSIARNLNQAVFKPADATRAGSSPIRGSAGVAWTNLLELSATTLIEAADSAMYKSKRAGSGEPVLAPPPQAQPVPLCRPADR